ncbi:EAL domain-containing protein [Marinomonas sp. C2222]|uniref:EAL domain-containing protein n=1 Tax=Marinomonas sargassi TaxID=2984494 RepID=A0ABT2YPR8_9GAMM|nr:EAL domain-containing protein [Marinomonas sargassi]MCV2401865.1 EAL domain-containing protein [Marinomonas sargassi]
MKFTDLTLTKRLIFSNLLSIFIISFAILIVIRSLYYVESTLNTQAHERIRVLAENSDISRRMLKLVSRIELLEQNFLLNDKTFAEEAAYINQELRDLRELSIHHDLDEKMGLFINNFQRFFGGSLALNRVLKQVQEIDLLIIKQIDELELLTEDKTVPSIENSWALYNQRSAIPKLRESFFSAGKLIGNLHSRITPEVENSLLAEIEKELAFFQLQLEEMRFSTPALKRKHQEITHNLYQLTTTLWRMKANLDRRRVVTKELLLAQSDLLSSVELIEKEVQADALELTQQLEEEISQSRFNAVFISVFACLLSILLVNLVVKRHIRKPLDDLRAGFKRVQSDMTNKPINLNRVDEWADIENAFNEMALRLFDTYTELKEEKKSFDYLAHHDPLTGLANRLLGTDRLHQEIKKASLQDTSFLLLYLDIDEFKTINDSLGHKSGDNLLIHVSTTLKELVHGIGHVSRMGGDEFMILIDDATTVREEGRVLKQINGALRQAYYIDGKSVFVSSSIGVCRYPDHGHDEATLIRNADTAMYHAKRNGKDQYRIYTDNMTLEVTDLVETSTALRQAIQNDELVVHLQPKMDIRTLEVTGAEALVRWNHPSLGLLQPFDFLEVAEKTDLINEIDKWVFKKVAVLISQWQKQGVNIDGMLFAVNFSARMFYMPDLAEQLQEILNGTDCKPQQIILEITERDMMRDSATCEQMINQLRSQGYQIAIDDFGMGYSSLSVVKNLSADYVKIDRSFVQDLATSRLDYEIVSAVLKFADVLGLSVIAEGVESQTHLDKLLELGCTKAQGYFFAKPLPVEDWLAFLLKNKN